MSDYWLHVFAADPRQPKPDLARLCAQLIERGFLLASKGADGPADYAAGKKAHYRFGPAFDTLYDVPTADEGYAYFQDFGERLMLEAGENMLMPPSIPDSERVVEDWEDFIDQWMGDPSRKWIDPETGRAYGLLDLDWENTIGAGTWFLSFFRPGRIDGEKTAALVSELIGQPCRYSWQHI